jgi:hypothetical protein
VVPPSRPDLGFNGCFRGVALNRETRATAQPSCSHRPGSSEIGIDTGTRLAELSVRSNVRVYENRKWNDAGLPSWAFSWFSQQPTQGGSLNFRAEAPDGSVWSAVASAARHRFVVGRDGRPVTTSVPALPKAPSPLRSAGALHKVTDRFMAPLRFQKTEVVTSHRPQETLSESHSPWQDFSE